MSSTSPPTKPYELPESTLVQLKTPYVLTNADYMELSRLDWEGYRDLNKEFTVTGSALSAAFRGESVELIEKLLRAGANTRPHFKHNFAFEAVIRRRPDFLTLVLNFDPTLLLDKDITQKTLFHCLVSSFESKPSFLNSKPPLEKFKREKVELELFDILHKFGCPVDLRSGDDLTALEYYFTNMSPFMVKRFVDARASLTPKMIKDSIKKDRFDLIDAVLDVPKVKAWRESKEMNAELLGLALPSSDKTWKSVNRFCSSKNLINWLSTKWAQKNYPFLLSGNIFDSNIARQRAHLLFKKSLETFQFENEKDHSLVIACLFKDPVLVEMLLKESANPNTLVKLEALKNIDALSALLVAYRFKSDPLPTWMQDQSTIAHLLIDQGVDSIQPSVKKFIKSGLSLYQNPSLAEVLIKRLPGVDIEIRSMLNSSPSLDSKVRSWIDDRLLEKVLLDTHESSPQNPPLSKNRL